MTSTHDSGLDFDAINAILAQFGPIDIPRPPTPTADYLSWRETLKPPPWLMSHPVLASRNIVLDGTTDSCLKPGTVYRTDINQDIPQYAVKIVGPESTEPSIYDRLLRSVTASSGHVLPCEVIRTPGEDTFLLMPLLRDLDDYPRWDWDGSTLIKVFRQILEGIDHLHSQNIAHMDIANSNILLTMAKDVVHHPHLQVDKIYFIDFGSSRQFDAGVGRQPAVELGPSQYKPPLDMHALDPFSWDVLCSGMVLRNLTENVKNLGILKASLLRRYTDWLIGREIGCTEVCHCRPSARKAIRVLAVIQWIFRIESLCRHTLTLLPRALLRLRPVRSD